MVGGGPDDPDPGVAHGYHGEIAATLIPDDVLQAKIKALEALIREEKAIVAATQSARNEGIQGLGKIAADQESTRRKTEAAQ